MRIAQQLDKVMMYTDHHMKQITISQLVNSKFVSVNESNNTNVKSSNRDLCGNVVMIWQLIHALQVNTRLLLDFHKIIQPIDDIEQFSNFVKPIFEQATEDVLAKKEQVIPLDGDNSLLSTNASERKFRKKCDASCYNESQKDVIIEGKLFKCNSVKVEGNLIKTYTKYFQCDMVLDRSDGSKWITSLLIVPSPLWNIDNLLVDKMKEALSNVPSK